MSNETRFTKGPWHTGEGRSSLFVFASDGYAIANAVVYHGRHSGEDEANAALIAAGPSLYTALKKYAEFCCCLKCHGDEMCEVCNDRYAEIQNEARATPAARGDAKGEGE
jgi:hypothetical protein